MTNFRPLFAALALFCALAMSFSGEVCANTGTVAVTADAPDTAPLTERERIQARIDEIDRENLPLDALYWSWRIVHTKDVTYSGLLNNSRNWIMSEDNRARLFERIDLLIAEGKTRPLTKAEREKYDANMEMTRQLLSPGAYDEKLINSLSDEACLEVISDCWSHYIRYGIWPNDIDNFAAPKKYKKDLKARTLKKMAITQHPPECGDIKLFDACRSKLR